MKRILASLLVLVTSMSFATAQDSGDHRYLYVAAPGIRNYLEFGGAGILVFDIDHGHRFVKRIETPESHAKRPDNMKGICACAATNKLYFTTPKKLYCLDLLSDKLLWQKQLPLGCDRMSITPDGKFLYVPTFENVAWNVVNGETGELIKTVETKSGAHNTVVGLDGSRMYLGGLKSPWLFVADTRTQAIVKKVGPFGGAIRPFTVDGKQSRCYVCVNGLLGFEIGDLASGKVVAHVEVEGFKTGPVKRHGCPSHGVGLSPEEKEVWVCDGHNSMLHVFERQSRRRSRSRASPFAISPAGSRSASTASMPIHPPAR